MADSGKLFISHAAVDKQMAEALVELLRLGADLPRDRIFCTSVEGTKVASGRNSGNVIRDTLVEAPLVLQLITPAFLTSTFCMWELGGQWALARDCFPLVVPLSRSTTSGVYSDKYKPPASMTQEAFTSYTTESARLSKSLQQRQSGVSSSRGS